MTIKSLDFCRASKVSLADFKEGLFIVSPVYFDYVKRDREKFVSQLIDNIIAKFNMDSTFRIMTKKLLNLFSRCLKTRKITSWRG